MQVKDAIGTEQHVTL